MAHDISSAPGRYPFPLGGGWTAVAIAPIPEVTVLALFFNGVPVEVIDGNDARQHILGIMSAAYRRLLLSAGSSASPASTAPAPNRSA